MLLFLVAFKTTILRTQLTLYCNCRSPGTVRLFHVTFGLENECSRERMVQGRNVLRKIRSRERMVLERTVHMFHGTFVPGNECSRERMFQGTKRTNVPDRLPKNWGWPKWMSDYVINKTFLLMFIWF